MLHLNDEVSTLPCYSSLCRDEYEALFGKGAGPLILARTDSLVTDGFGKHQCNSSFIVVTCKECRTNLTSGNNHILFGYHKSMPSNVVSDFEKSDVT